MMIAISRGLMLLPALGLAACVGGVASAPNPDDGIADTCGAAELQNLVGQPKDVLATMTFATPPRVISPGEGVTRDFGEGRLNIDLDANDTITRLWCG
jgi:Peptidase inhibitor I78 family